MSLLNWIGRLLVIASTSFLVLLLTVAGLLTAGVGPFWATMIASMLTVGTAAGLVMITDRYRA